MTVKTLPVALGYEATLVIPAKAGIQRRERVKDDFGEATTKPSCPHNPKLYEAFTNTSVCRRRKFASGSLELASVAPTYSVVPKLRR
jgi:hypothetical protein